MNSVPDLDEIRSEDEPGKINESRKNSEKRTSSIKDTIFDVINKHRKNTVNKIFSRQGSDQSGNVDPDKKRNIFINKIPTSNSKKVQFCSNRIRFLGYNFCNLLTYKIVLKLIFISALQSTV